MCQRDCTGERAFKSTSFCRRERTLTAIKRQRRRGRRSRERTEVSVWFFDDFKRGRCLNEILPVVLVAWVFSHNLQAQLAKC